MMVQTSLVLAVALCITSIGTTTPTGHVAPLGSVQPFGATLNVVEFSNGAHVTLIGDTGKHQYSYFNGELHHISGPKVLDNLYIQGGLRCRFCKTEFLESEVAHIRKGTPISEDALLIRDSHSLFLFFNGEKHYIHDEAMLVQYDLDKSKIKLFPDEIVKALPESYPMPR